jgi:hypothetical protein
MEKRMNCGEVITRHLMKVRDATPGSNHCSAWTSPIGPEKYVRNEIRAFAEMVDTVEGITENNHPFARYLRAKALILRAMARELPIGRFSRARLNLLVTEVVTTSGLDWNELEPYEEQ